MRNIPVLVFILFVASSYSAGAQTNSWNGLTPLKSTKSDVEKILGSPTARAYDDAFEYIISRTSISVYYSAKHCDSGWNVPENTVLKISVSPKDSMNKSAIELNLDRKGFFVTVDDAFYATWIDPVAGHSYYFGGIDREFIHMSFIPTREQNNLRCNGWPPYRPEGRHYPFYTTGLSVPKGQKFDLGRAATLINSFAIEVSRNGEKYQGYVLVYFDNKFPLTEYRRRVSLIKEIAFKFLKVPKTDIIFIEGGMRDESYVELYLLPRDWPPPSPDPTLPSPQFLRKQ